MKENYNQKLNNLKKIKKNYLDKNKRMRKNLQKKKKD